MADGFHMDTMAVKNLGSKVESLSSAYEAKIKRIEDLIAELNAAWKGADYQAYAQKVDQNKPAMDEMTKVARSYGEFLNSAATKVDSIREQR